MDSVELNVKPIDRLWLSPLNSIHFLQTFNIVNKVIKKIYSTHLVVL